MALATTTKEHRMAYPTSATTYLLPFGDKIRVSSNRRFILVRWIETEEARPYIVRRSEARSRVVSEYNPGTDYIIDQVTAEVTYHFGHHAEKFDGKTGKDLGPTGTYTARTLHGQVEI
jgi:hypothetical protein